MSLVTVKVVNILKEDAWYNILITEPAYDFIQTDDESNQLFHCLKTLRHLNFLLRSASSTPSKYKHRRIVEVALRFKRELNKLYNVQYSDDELDRTYSTLEEIRRSI